MAKRNLVLAVVVLSIGSMAVVACSSSDPYEPAPASERPRGSGAGFRGGAGDGAMLELLPPANWWRDDRIAPAVNLTTDQLAALDRIYDEQHDDIARLQRDTQVAVRQLRDSVSLEQPKAEDITSAGQRIRTLRDDIFDRQLKMLADERLVLSSKQWASLQDALQSARSQRQERGGYPGGRGRGGFGGRRPGRGF